MILRYSSGVCVHRGALAVLRGVVASGRERVLWLVVRVHARVHDFDRNLRRGVGGAVS